MKVPHGLVAKYGAYFATLVGVALIASGALNLTFSYREEQQALARLQQEQVRGAAAQIERFIGDIERQVALSPAQVADLLTPDRNEWRLELARLLRQAPAIGDAVLLDRNGIELAYASRIGTETGLRDRNWVRDAAYIVGRRDGKYVSPVFFRGGTEPYLTMAMRGTSRESAVVIAEINLKFILDLISKVHAGVSGHAYVVDAGGYLIAHPDISLVLHKTDLSTLAQVRSARENPMRYGDTTIAATDHLGNAVVTSFAPIASLGWFVFVEQPETEALAPLYGTLRRTGLLLVGGLVLSLGTSVLLARHVVRPIRALQAGASAIGAGRLEHRIDIETGDELQTLAAEFNRMAARLQESHADLEARIEARTHELAVASRHKSEFLAAMSHELRTPLNAIIGFSDVLRTRMFGELNPKQAKYAEVIHASGKHLLSLINDILDLSKVEAGRMALDVVRFSVPATIDDALTLVRAKAADKSISIEVELDPELQFAWADERKLRQVLLNLLTNAIKFTPEGGRIGIAGTRLSDSITIAVSDTGIGIDPQHHKAIFDEFTQIDGARHAGGTGLGLAIAKRFVELHGGTIVVGSAPGNGAVFTVTLPQPRTEAESIRQPATA